MKKNKIIIIFAIIFSIFCNGFAYCEENNSNSANSPEAIKAQEKLHKKELKKQKKLKKELSKKKKDKDIKPEDMKGYYGKLPDIGGDFKYKEQNVTTPSRQLKTLEDDDYKESDLKTTQTDDALFLDIIVKKEAASTYVNDIQKTKFALQNLKKCIEEQGNIQRFNGCVNVLALYTKNLKTKYENKSESLKESYNDILLTDYYAKVLGNLLYNANYYSQYVPTTEGEYSKDNIENEKQNLLNRINKTLFSINQES